MSICVRCPDCSKDFTVPPDREEKHFFCSHCGQLLWKVDPETGIKWRAGSPPEAPATIINEPKRKAPDSTGSGALPQSPKATSKQIDNNNAGFWTIMAVGSFWTSVIILLTIIVAFVSNRTPQHTSLESDDHPITDRSSIKDKKEPSVYSASGLQKQIITLSTPSSDDGKSIAAYTNQIQKTPLDATLYLDRGCVYFRKALYDEAIVDFESAIDLHPTYSLAYHHLGVALVVLVQPNIEF